MLNNHINKIFKREIIKSFTLLSGLFLIFMCFITYIQISNTTNEFNKAIKQDKILLNSDFKKLQLSYKKQLKYVRSQIESLSFDAEKINNYFNSDSAIILDRSSISTIIVTDSNGKIIFSNLLDKKNVIDNSLLKTRKYFQTLMKNPDQIVFGEIVTGILTQTPAIPIATGIRDKNNNFIGTIIFSVSLDNISKDLSNHSIISINIQNPISLNTANNYINTPQISWYSFISQLMTNDHYVEINSNSLIQKDIEIIYDLFPYKTKLIRDMILYSLIVLLILSSIFVFYYFSILKPLKPTLHIIQNISDLDSNAANLNLFTDVTNSITNQSKLLQEKEYVYKEQLAQIISVICSIGSLTNYVKNKLEILTEEIEDINSVTTLSSKDLKLKLKDIGKVVKENKNDVNSVLSNFNSVFRILESQQKQEFNIRELLITSDINNSLLNKKMHSDSNAVLKIHNYSVRVYKTLFKTMIDEIMQFQSHALKINSIEIAENNKLEFIFREISDSTILSHHERLVLCKLWGIFNDILITIEYNKNEIKIICQFN